MKATLAPPSMPLCSSRYIWKPLTMSVPSWVMMPVRGARNPILSSCACAGIALTAATHSSGSTRVSLFIVGPLLCDVVSCSNTSSHNQSASLAVHADALEEVASGQVDVGACPKVLARLYSLTASAHVF